MVDSYIVTSKPGVNAVALFPQFAARTKSWARFPWLTCIDLTVGEANQVKANPNVVDVRLSPAVNLPDPIDEGAPTDIGDLEYDTGNNDWGVSRIGSKTLHDQGIFGAGVNVAVVDTGQGSHVDMIWVGGFNAINPALPPTDGHGHSTHVGGTIAALLNGQGVAGVAPGVNLFGVKVLNDSGSGSWPDIMTGLQWCIDNGMQVTNHSYGGSSNPGPGVEAAYQACVDAGIIQVASAGNSGAGPNTVGFPAQFSSLIAVAATTRDNTRATFSSTGPAVECSGPGQSIGSTHLNNLYRVLSGTSTAAPHVTASMALAVSRGIQNPRALLETTCELLPGQTGRDNNFGLGLINPVALLNAPGEVFNRSIVADASLSSDPDGTISDYTFDWGDGTPPDSGIEPILEHTYLADGQYLVSIMGTDNDGDISDEVSRTIIVQEAAPPPPPNQPPSMVLEIRNAVPDTGLKPKFTMEVATSTQITFNARLSEFPPERQIVKYLWWWTDWPLQPFEITNPGISVGFRNFPGLKKEVQLQIVDDLGNVSAKTAVRFFDIPNSNPPGTILP